MSSIEPRESLSKKRKLRKGTRSCWDCKRRKARCIFSSENDVKCLGCRRRGIECVSQEDEDLAAEALENGTIKVSDRRLHRMEQMLEVLVKNCTEGLVDGNIPVELMTKSLEPAVAPHDLNISVSRVLHSLLPSVEESQKLCASALFVPCFFQQLLTRDYLTLSASGCVPRTGAHVARLPSQDAPPILIAQKLLMFACLAQYIPELEIWKEAKSRSEAMARAAIDMITTKDEFIQNAEGLECIMLEAAYHLNNGHLRRAFSAVRRAMATAQLLGIHRLIHRDVRRIDDGAPQFDPSYMWYRITYVDRLLCLILGLPKGSPDIGLNPPPEPPTLTLEQRLEREHCSVASRILDRVETDEDSMESIQSIDVSLQEIASSLPSNWWLTPNLSTVDSPREMFQSTTRLVNQLFHFNLINQTHLPNLLKPDPVGQDSTMYWYSKAACVAASREILHRYLAVQDSGFVAYAYHFVDFFALIAAITLLLVHLDHHWQHTGERLNVLSHMRLSDRAMIQQASQRMGKPPTCKGPAMLDQLLVIEEEAFASFSVGSGNIKKGNGDTDPFFELNIPYYGRLRVNSAKICFKRTLDIEDLSSSIERLPSPECQSNGKPENLDDTFFEGWLDATLDPGAISDPYGGTEMAFFDSLQGFLQDTT